MRVVSCQVLEDCLDGSMIHRLEFDDVVGRGAIEHLGALGRLEYFADFARPFYRITASGDFMLKGVEGNAHCLLVTFRALPEAEGVVRRRLELLAVPQQAVSPAERKDRRTWDLG